MNMCCLARTAAVFELNAGIHAGAWKAETACIDATVEANADAATAASWPGCTGCRS